MSQDASMQMSLFKVRLLLEEGQPSVALSTLQTLQHSTECEEHDIAYLFGWCYIQRKLWEDAIRTLSPLLAKIQGSPSLELESLLEQTRPASEAEFDTLLDRERLVYLLLYLGIAAVNLSHYEDASQHFSLCLKILHDRRVHLPSVRIRARYSLAMTCLMRGLYPVAIQQYEEALRLCKHYGNEEEVPHIYYGLCTAYRYTGDFVRAYLVGEDALHLYEQHQERGLEARMHNLLGRIQFLLGDYRSAGDHYTESLALASNHNGPTLVMVNCAALAELRLAEGRLPEARRYCQSVLETIERSEHPHMRGQALLVIGKVAREEARGAPEERQRAFLEEAAGWFERANVQLEQTQAYPDRAEVYGCWAQTLEDLGRAGEAIERWREGYKFLTRQSSTAVV